MHEQLVPHVAIYKLEIMFQVFVILLMEEILHRLIWSISHYLQGFIHVGWCRISSITSRSPSKPKWIFYGTQLLCSLCPLPMVP